MGRNRIAGIILGTILSVGLLSYLEEKRPTDSMTLVPENRGAIKEIAVQYTHDAAPYLLPAYRSFFTQIDPSVRVVAVCSNDAEAREFQGFIQSTGMAHPERVRTLSAGVTITAWCRDRFLMAEGAPLKLVCPRLNDTGFETRSNDSRVAGVIANNQNAKYSACTTPLIFDAGDLFPSTGVTFVNDELWMKNPKEKNLDSTLTRMFNGRIVRLKGSPAHHIGMFAAPLDEKHVLIGDTELGWKLWQENWKNNKEKLAQPDHSPTALKPFAATASELKAAGFEVTSLPTVVLGTKVYISYTNGVFETRGNKKIVYMPWYEIPTMDEAARKVYVNAGWEVHPIPVKTLYRFRGTIGCVVNVLDRGQ